MAVVRTGWGKIRSGHLIDFIYNGTKRVCIVMMCPNDSGTADATHLHCLQLVDAGIGVFSLRTRLDYFLDCTKGCSLIDFDKDYGPFFKFNIGWKADDRVQPRQLYRILRGIIKTNDLYKTFSWEKVKTSSVKFSNDELNILNIPFKHLVQSGCPTMNDCMNHKTQKLLFEYPTIRTFRRIARQPKYYPGQVWREKNGRWSAKNDKMETKSFNTVIKAMEWALERKRKAAKLSAKVNAQIKDFVEENKRLEERYKAVFTKQLMKGVSSTKEQQDWDTVQSVGGFKMMGKRPSGRSGGAKVIKKK